MTQGTFEPTEILDLSEFDEPGIPCDYNDQRWYSTPNIEHGEAKWVAHVSCTECSFGGIRLICQACKDLLISTPHAMTCGKCEAVMIPARRVFKSLKRL